MGTDFIPRKDEELGPFLQQFVTGATGHEVALGTTVGQVALVNDAHDDWTNALAACQAAQTALDAALVSKAAVRATATGLMRSINAKAQITTTATDVLKAAADLPLHDTTPTRAGTPSTFPVLVVDPLGRNEHKLSYRDHDTPLSRAKPPGVREIEIWCKVGSPEPADASQCVLIGTSSTSTLLHTHAGADAGKTAYYLARWKNAHGDCGPWSELASATIGA